MENKIKILLIEDCENDYVLIKRALTKGGMDCSLTWTYDIDDLERLLLKEKFDVILSDYNMFKFDGYDVFNVYKKLDFDIPFILVSGTVGEDIAVKFMKLGVNDYIMKQNLNRLVPAIEREIKESKIRKEHKETQQKLIRSEKKFRHIFENIRDIYYQTDINGIILEVSPSVSRYSEYSREDLIGRAVTDFYVDISERNEFQKSLFKKGEVTDFEIKLKVNDFKIAYTSVNAHLIYDENNQPYKIEGIIRDITERKNSEIALKAALIRAEESDHLKTAFINNISHEIRTPLNGIVGFINLLNNFNLKHTEINDYINYIKQSSDRLIETISNLILLSEIETKQLKFDNTYFSVNSLISDIYNTYYHKALIKGIKLKINIQNPEEDSIIFGDETRYFQAISNIVNNAVKFTETGYIYFDYKICNNNIIFTIRDTGIGIKKEMLFKIFNKFRQSDSSDSRGYEGVGIGLSITKGIIEMMGGSIFVESEQNKGSVFSVKIPFNEELNRQIKYQVQDYSYADN